MSEPERVNVMLSRARNGLVIIGNPDTFIQSHKGKAVWVPLMHKLKTDGHVYDGFPVKCERHPEKTALLTQKEQFDTVCPDGGCSEPWYVIQELQGSNTEAYAAGFYLLVGFINALKVAINCKTTLKCNAPLL